MTVLGSGRVAAAKEVVVATAAQDGVVALLTHDHVIAGAGVDEIIVRVALQVGVLGQDRREDERAAQGGIQRGQLRTRHEGDGGDGGIDSAVGTEDQIVAAAARNGVVAGPAEHDVAARTVRDPVAAIGVRLY